MIQTLKFKSIYFSTLLFLVFSSCIKEPVNPNNNNGTSNLTDTTMLNVSYGSHIRQVYDIYLPKNRDTNTPVILMIHGGAWKAGQKEDFNYYRDLIKAKWNSVAIVNMNYRLASNTNNIHHNEILADISSVVNSINSNQANYQISKKIGVIGASAGGQLAMIYAYKYNNNIKCVGNIFGPSIINDWSWYNSTNIWLGVQMKDVLTEYVGQTWDTTAYKAVSPYWNISPKPLPPMLKRQTTQQDND
jgi:acetyl esterase/lipase